MSAYSVTLLGGVACHAHSSSSSSSSSTTGFLATCFHGSPWWHSAVKRREPRLGLLRWPLLLLVRVVKGLLRACRERLGPRGLERRMEACGLRFFWRPVDSTSKQSLSHSSGQALSSEDPGHRSILSQSQRQPMDPRNPGQGSEAPALAALLAEVALPFLPEIGKGPRPRLRHARTSRTSLRGGIFEPLPFPLSLPFPLPSLDLP